MKSNIYKKSKLVESISLNAALPSFNLLQPPETSFSVDLKTIQAVTTTALSAELDFGVMPELASQAQNAGWF